MALGIGRFAFTPLLPMMLDDAGISVAQGGRLAAANYAGYLVGALWATQQRARAGAAIRVALLAIGLSTLGMGLTGGVGLWLILRIVAGIASAWVLIHVSSWCLERLVPLRNPLLTGTVFAGVGAGIAIAGGLCLALMGMRAGSAQAWITLGVVSLAVTAAVWPVLGGKDAAERASSLASGRYRWSADAVRLVFCYGAFGFGYIIPATFIPAMAKRAIEDPLIFGWLWPLFGLTAVASNLLVAPLARMAGHRRLWSLGALAMAAGVAGPLAFPGLAGVAVAALLVGATFNVITMAGMQEARNVAGACAPVLMAALTAAFAAGQIAGPIVAGAIAKPDGEFPAALALACALLALSAAALWSRPAEPSAKP